MNRAERRRLERQAGKDIAATISNQKKVVTDEAIDVAYSLFLFSSLKFLREKGWGKKRITEFVEGVISYAENGYEKEEVEELSSTIIDEYGIDLGFCERYWKRLCDR